MTQMNSISKLFRTETIFMNSKNEFKILPENNFIIKIFF